MHNARELTGLLILCALGCASSSASSSGASASRGTDASLQDGSSGAGPSDAGVVSEPVRDGSDGFALSDGGSAGEASSLEDAGCPATTPTCPASAPSQGAPCEAPFGFHCEYGDDPVSRCNTVAWCRPGTGWIVSAPLANSTGCPTTRPASCPATAAAANSAPTACASNSFQCIYPEETCDCDPSGRGPMLVCSPLAPAMCPATRPRYGTQCSSEGGACMQWGGDCATPSVERARCTCGTWQPLACTML